MVLWWAIFLTQIWKDFGKITPIKKQKNQLWTNWVGGIPASENFAFHACHGLSRSPIYPKSIIQQDVYRKALSLEKPKKEDHEANLIKRYRFAFSVRGACFIDTAFSGHSERICSFLGRGQERPRATVSCLGAFFGVLFGSFLGAFWVLDVWPYQRAFWG